MGVGGRQPGAVGPQRSEPVPSLQGQVAATRETRAPGRQVKGPSGCGSGMGGTLLMRGHDCAPQTLLYRQSQTPRGHSRAKPRQARVASTWALGPTIGPSLPSHFMVSAVAGSTGASGVDEAGGQLSSSAGDPGLGGTPAPSRPESQPCATLGSCPCRPHPPWSLELPTPRPRG